MPKETRRRDIVNCAFCKNLRLLRLKARPPDSPSYVSTDYLLCAKCNRVFKQGLNEVKFVKKRKVDVTE